MTAGINGTVVVVPKVDGKLVDTAANVLANNGYTVTGLFNGAYWATKNGTTYFFTESNPEYYTLTVNGTVVEYMAKNTASKISEKEFAAKYGTDGTAYKFVKGGTTSFFAYAPNSNTAMTDGTATVVIETGYVTVTGATLTGYTVKAPEYVKANSTFTVTVESNSAISENTSITVNGTEKSGNGTAKELSFTVSAANADVTLNVTASTVYKVTANGVSTATNGLTATVDGPKMAKPGETVTFTVTLNGTVAGTSGQSLKVSASDITWLDTGAITNATRAGNELTLASGTVIANATVQFSYTLSSSAPADATIDLSIGTLS